MTPDKLPRTIQFIHDVGPHLKAFLWAAGGYVAAVIQGWTTSL